MSACSTGQGLCDQEWIMDQAWEGGTWGGADKPVSVTDVGAMGS